MFERFAVEGQLRGDHYNQTGADWSGRLTGLLSLDDQDHHVVRLSAARAFRAPTAIWRDSGITRQTLLNLFLPSANMVLPPDGLGHEHITSYELGYTALLSPNYTFRINAFYQEYEDMLIYKAASAPLPLPVRLENAAKASALGGEVEFEIKGSSGRLLLWGSYHEFDWKNDGTAFRTPVAPTRVKAGLSGQLNLPMDCILSMHYKYSGKSDFVYGMTAKQWPATHRLDAALSRTFFDGKAELLLGITDLLDDTGDPMSQPASGTPAYETQGRTFFVRAGVKF